MEDCVVILIVWFPPLYRFPGENVQSDDVWITSLEGVPEFKYLNGPFQVGS